MKIVVLDDSSTVLLTIQALLEGLGVLDESIVMFKDGYKALEYIEHNGADVIFSDINMPGMDGFEFVEKLLELSTRFISTLFVVSGDESNYSFSLMKQVGAKRFIRKPIEAKYFNHFVAPEIHKIKNRLNEQEPLSKDDNKDSVKNQMIDYDQLAAQIGIKPKHIPALIKSFIEESFTLIEQLKDAIEYKYYNQIERYAHSLKGSSGNMHFLDLSEVCRSVELAAQNEDAGFDYTTSCSLIEQEVMNISKRLA